MATATLVNKRKHEQLADDSVPHSEKNSKPKLASNYRKTQHPHTQTQPVLEREVRNPVEVALSESNTIQIVTGSYDRGILHGITASIPSHLLDPSESRPLHDGSNGPTAGETVERENVSFTDSFLFAAHTASIRCLGISGPSETGKRILATGGSDERINLYALATTASSRSSTSSTIANSALPSLASHSNAQNPRNRSLGNLVHHDRAITRLHFPPNSNKLFSGAEDNNIAITRTRDWTLLSSIRAPIPKPTGRPSGDTAAPGEVPAGINDFAIHPSQKLMLSVGRGERCLRLWNLMTGKKAGVLNFEREVLAQIGEGKYSSGEGRRVLWSEDGEAYVVVFERGAVVFGLDSKARAVIRPSPSIKLHQVRLLPKPAESGRETLAFSTEDGRVLFYDARTPSADAEADDNAKKTALPSCPCIAQLGGQAAGISGRIKDFEIVSVPRSSEVSNSGCSLLVVTGSSDGAVRIWNQTFLELAVPDDVNGSTNGDEFKDPASKQVGTLIGTVETGNRITCLGAFVMDGKPIGNEQLDEAEESDINMAERERESENDSWDGFAGE